MAVLLGRHAGAHGDNSTRWEVEASASFVTTGDFRGVGVAAGVLHGFGRYFALGLNGDVAYLGASGIADERFGSSFSYSFLALMVSGAAQLRVPVGPVMPYVDARIGLAGTMTLEDENTQCGYGTGFAVGAGIGLELAVARRIAVGVRGSARTVAGSMGCDAAGGPYSFDAVVLYALGASVRLRW